MARPGTVVSVIDQTPPVSAPTTTDTAFIVGFTDKGPVGSATEIRSMERLKSVYGDRVSYGYVYDAVETIFRESRGTARVYVSRVVGPSPTNASVKLFDQSGSTDPADVALVVTAKNAGSWGASLNATVTVDGSNFTIEISHDTDGVVENSGTLADRAAAVTWSAGSDYVDITLGASNEDPRAVASSSFTGGTDDHSNATDATWLAALDEFDRLLGPGQVLAPGRTTTAGHTQLLDHAAANNRVALLDSTDTPTVATITAQAAAQQSDSNARYAQLLAPWVVIPGITGGTTRTVPPSAFQAGLLARSDALNSANVPAAGENGQARYATDLTQAWTDSQRETLNEAGVTVIRDVYNTIQTYGIRSLADPDEDSLWLQFPGARYLMSIRARVEAVAESFLFEQIDGRGIVFARLKSAIEGELLPDYEAGSLYGSSPEDAFVVDTGDQVNTEETIADGQIKAAVGVRVSPGAEYVYIEIARTAVDQSL